MKKEIVKIVVFVLVFYIIWYGALNPILKFKFQNIETEFYQQPKNTIDVMLYGCSHSYTGIIPSMLWENSGISSFCFGGASQPAWNTYYYMLESLETQKPKVMIYEVTGLISDEDEVRSSENNINLKFSKRKIESVKVSTNKKNYLNLLLSFPVYHYRYSQLTADDFENFIWSKPKKNKGFTALEGIMPLKRPIDLERYTDVGELHTKQEEYLYKIINLAKEKDIELVLMVTPWYVEQQYQEKFNRISEIAEENDIPFINLNLAYDDIGIDFASDFNDGSHTNISGSQKVTNYMLKYLNHRYDLPDHRNDFRYISWEENKEYSNQIIKKFNLKNEKDIDKYVEYLKDDNYIVIITSTRAGISQVNPSMGEKLIKIGISKQLIEQNEWCYGAILNGNKVVKEKAQYEPFEISYIYDNTEFYGNVDRWNTIGQVGNNNPLNNGEQGINFLVYDKNLKKVVDQVCFNKIEDRFMVKR